MTYCSPLRRWFGFTCLLGLVPACATTAPAPQSSAQTAKVIGDTRPAAAPALPVDPAGTPHAPADQNPFLGARFYVNPEYTAKVNRTAANLPAEAATVKKVGGYATGLWLDSIASVNSISRSLDDAQKQSAQGTPTVPVFLVYNLPNRDCSAKSSNGELTLENNGESRYRTEFIDKIAEQFRAHPSQRIVAIIEPDSLPNIVTNLGVPKCSISENLYRSSVAYAVAKLSLPNVHIYLDAAHAGWLGWDSNRAGIAKVFKEVLAAAGGVDRIRGFATNISGYNVLRGDDGKRMEPSNPCPDELTYVQKLAQTLEAEGITNKGFIIDTSRNGKGGIRSKWGNWCNIKGAGLGERPTVAPAPLLDAYFWVKPPGDSDGTSDPTAARFDATCASADAAPNAPEAGQWFESHFMGLVRGATPPL